MDDKEKHVEVAKEAKIEEVNTQSHETVADDVMTDKDDKESIDHLNSDQNLGDLVKDTDTGDFNNDENGNSNDVISNKETDNMRCSTSIEDVQSREILTTSNGQDVEAKNEKIEENKFGSEPLHGDEFNKDDIDAQVNIREEVDENDTVDVKDDITFEGEDEKDKDLVEGELKTNEGNCIQSKCEQDDEKKGETTNPCEDERQQWTSKNARNDDNKVEEELQVQEHNDDEGKLKLQDDVKGIEGEKLNELDIKVNEGDTALKTLENVKEVSVELKSEKRAEVNQLDGEKDKDDEMEEEKKRRDEIKVDDDKEKCDEIEVEEKNVETRVAEAEEKPDVMKLEKEETVDEEQRKEEEESEDEVVEKIKQIKQKGSEDEENETEDEALEKVEKERLKDEDKEIKDDLERKMEEKGLENDEMETDDEPVDTIEKGVSKDEKMGTEDDSFEKIEKIVSEDEEKETKDDGSEKMEENESEDEEKGPKEKAVERKGEEILEDEGKETEVEAEKKQAKKLVKTSKRKGKRSRSWEFEKRKMPKQENSPEKNEDMEQIAEEDSKMKRKSDIVDKSPKVTKKMRLTAKRSAGRKHESGNTTKKNKASIESIEMEPINPYIGRPQRERKTVERLVSLVEKDASRDLKIGKGLGTPLKDIPNVSHKLSRRKTDDTLKLLHTIIFGRRTKAVQVKANILRFSGFVWPDDEDKHRSKVKVKFEKCNKEKLLEFCDLFGLSVTKGSSKKEDIVSKLIDFLIHPCGSSTPEKEKDNQTNKRIRNDSSSKNASSKYSSKRRELSGSKKSKRFDDNSDDTQEEEEDEKDEVEKKSNEDEGDNSSDQKSDEKDDSEEEYRGNRSSSKRKRSASKGKKPNLSAKKKPTKSASNKQTKSTAKKRSGETSEEKGNSKGKSTLTDDELRDATCELLNEVDFNTATFTDILELLGKQFDTDLSSRKASIKLMIQEELTKFAEEEESSLH